tara:strand:+ start:1158 stop:1298 length:141 start_codon:yes stop_codon:yes gene_type:complete
MYNSMYKKTKDEWIKKQIEKQLDYNIEYDSNKIILSDKKVKDIKKL